MNMPVNPLILAKMSEDEIKKVMTKVSLETSLIRQLLVGRVVRNPRADGKYTVTQVSIAGDGRAVLHGTKRKNSHVIHTIGPLQAVEIVEPKS